MTTPTDPAPAAGVETGERPSQAMRWSAPAIVLAALGWAYGPDLLALVETWSDDPDYSHGFLVLPIALLILWQRWPRAQSAEPGAVGLSPSLWGWGLLVLSLLGHAVFYELGRFWLMTATLLPVLVALALSY